MIAPYCVCDAWANGRNWFIWNVFFFKQMMPCRSGSKGLCGSAITPAYPDNSFFSANTANNYELYRVVVSNILSSY